jgi:hypothetical protein
MLAKVEPAFAFVLRAEWLHPAMERGGDPEDVRSARVSDPAETGDRRSPSSTAPSKANCPAPNKPNFGR